MERVEQWTMRGEYFESCNCDILCPCITSSAKAMPTQVHCDVMLAYHIQHGEADGVSLNGITFVIALQTPGPMIEGQAKVAIYIDEAADERQRESLQTIVAGQAGGPISVFMDAMQVEELKGFRYVPITFRIEGNQRSLMMPGIMEMTVEGIGGPGGTIMELRNTRHPANTNLALARTIEATYQDFDFDWNNAGKNAHYADFSWKGP